MEVPGQIRAAERTRNLPVIIMPSSADEQNRINSYDLGPVSYVRNPVDFRNLLDAVLQCGLHWLLLDQPSMEKPAASLNASRS